MWRVQISLVAAPASASRLGPNAHSQGRVGGAWTVRRVLARLAWFPPRRPYRDHGTAGSRIAQRMRYP
jgi:hypothetical protein